MSGTQPNRVTILVGAPPITQTRVFVDPEAMFTAKSPGVPVCTLFGVVPENQDMRGKPSNATATP